MATKVVSKSEQPTQVQDATLQLTGAAVALLELLDERERFLIEQTCEGQQLEPWMYIVGILKRALDTGEHTLPTVDPLWRSWTGGWKTKIISDAVCPICNKTFTPQWRGQVYDRNECGAAAELGKRSAPVGEPAAYTVGEEPAEMLKSTVRDADSATVPTFEQTLAEAERELAAAVKERSAAGGLGERAPVETAG